MKKSVRIRKAGPGEKPGYYNKTANFLNKALPKAKMGMQMNSNNNMQERLKVIMLDTYANLRDGMEPNIVFENLVTKYGVDQEMAFQIINTVMTKLAEQGHKDPAYLNQDEEEDDYANNNNPQTPEPAKPATPNVGTPNEDEELALSESDMASGVDPGTEEYAQASTFQQYGGYYDEGGELDYDYPNYFDNADSTEQTILDQYSNPGQLSTEDQIPFDLSRLIKFTPGAQNFPQTPDLNYYLGNYRGVADESSIPTDLLPANKHGGLHKFAKGGPGGPGKGKGKRRPRKEKTPTETEAPTAGTTSTEIPVVETPGPQRIVTPQETVTAPSTWQKYQNFYARKNPLSDRGVVGRQIENLGTLINTVRPQNWREKWRAQVAPSTTTTKIITDINALIENDKYEPSVLQKNTDGSFNTGLGFNLDPSFADFLLKNTEQLDALLAKGKKKSAELDLDKLSELRNTGIPESISPELDFLSIHRQNNGKLKFTKDENGLFKVEIVSEVPTRLKGYNKKALTIKDELIIDPKTKEIIDPKTKLPLETVDKNYYMGNQLNWYNSPYRFPFTAKYPGLDLSTYPQIISENPLKKEPVSGWNTAWNMIGKPMVFSPMSLPFTYPAFAARSKFYPNASNIKTQFLGAQREIGPQAPGGMTFGDQPFGAQYADYNLLKNRNFQTGANFLKYAGILGGLGYLGYNQFLSQPDKDDITDKGQKESILKENINLEGRGRAGNDRNFGVTRSGYDKDSILIENGDTINDKGWATPAPDYKKGGAQKKQFVKNVMSKFAPGGEFGKGNRMDNLKNDVTKKKSNFVGTLKKQSDKVATEELYNAVQKSGDPQLMNIFMGQDQNPAQQMQQQFAEHGGFIDMDSKNPLTKFISGGDEDCPPGTYWDERVKKCVPIGPLEDYPEQFKPSRQELNDDPYKDYLKKLDYRRDVQDYLQWHDDQIPGLMNRKLVYPGDEDYPNESTPKNRYEPGFYLDPNKPMRIPDSENPISPELQNFINTYPSQDDLEEGRGIPFDLLPDEVKNKFKMDRYPQIGPWNKKDQKAYDDLFNDYIMEQPIDPETGERIYVIPGKGPGGYGKEVDPIKTIIKDKNSYDDEIQKRIDWWCPCTKMQPTMVQGKKVLQKICVPCEEAKNGGYIGSDFYEPYSLPEAGDGIIVPGGSGGQYILGKMPPGGEGGQLLDLDDPSLIKDHWGKSCPPGSVWSEKYQQCVPLMKTVYKPRVVQGRPSMASTLLPWNPIFRSYLTTAPKISRRDNPYSRKNLRQFSKDFSGRGKPRIGYNMRQFLTRSLPFGALLQPKYDIGGISDPSQGDINLASSNVSPYEYNPNVPQNNMVDNSFIPVTDFRDQTTLNSNMFANPNQDQKHDTNYYDPTQYRKVTTMDGEAFNNVFNAGLNATSGYINRLQNNPRSLATTYQATNLLRQVPISNQTHKGDQQDVGQNLGFRGPEQGSERNSFSTFGNYPGAATGGFLAYGGFLEDGGYTDPYMEEEEVYMTPEELEQFLKAGGQVEYL
jgi:hypothetical protein